MNTITNETRQITITLPTRTASLLTASSIHESANVSDYMVVAAVTTARALIDKDLAGGHTEMRWQFVDERWLRRHSRRIHRYVRRGCRFIVTLHGEPIGYLLRPTAGPEGPRTAPRTQRKRHP
ncbi:MULTISPECIES: hypothetical protein [unclassified Curtobacterium]|uniref:hypothetical protein n=1 Tax=unclassified Curtobacterium TaxID=257496 RepID=UPI000F4A3EB1|nr:MULTISPECIES: hypothetical protein [unclassified Curtobacterium]ROQ04771.1 hypothetical protein EDF41_3422 [Curtobacterium sp. PhB171]ROQ28279.1 hypothetical protein EDF40_1414 [Curtobacterium sp. PhB170]ROS33188.1 hypothetical protein EDF25_3246 [Curtobacterium sp. PhB131]ROS72424.1 hypothetical protein EDF30_0349 [Curtobacterium sp. PhB141]